MTVECVRGSLERVENGRADERRDSTMKLNYIKAEWALFPLTLRAWLFDTGIFKSERRFDFLNSVRKQLSEMVTLHKLPPTSSINIQTYVRWIRGGSEN